MLLIYTLKIFISCQYPHTYRSGYSLESQLYSIDSVSVLRQIGHTPFIQALQGVRHLDFVTPQVTIASTLGSTKHTHHRCACGQITPFLSHFGWSEMLRTLTGTPSLCRSTRAFPTRRLVVFGDSKISKKVELARLSNFPGMII